MKGYAPKVSDLVIARTIEFKTSNVSNPLNIATITAVVPAGYKFLCWMNLASVGWVINSPTYFETQTSETTNVWVGAQQATGLSMMASYLVTKI